MVSGTWALKCNKCPFQSNPQELYDAYTREGRDNRGRKNSTLNDTLGTALLSSPIGAQNFSELFLKLGLDPGSLSGLNKLLRRVGKQVEALGGQVMAETQSEVKTFSNKWILTFDVKYNNPIFSAKTPWQAGTEAVATAVDETSGQKKIVHVGTYSKLCPTGQRLRREGFEIECPGHPDCTANLKMTDSIGNEGFYSETMANDLKKEGVALDVL